MIHQEFPSVAERAANHCDALLKRRAAPAELAPEFERFGERLAAPLRRCLEEAWGDRALQVRPLGTRAIAAAGLRELGAGQVAASLHGFGHDHELLLCLDGRAMLEQLDRALGGTGEIAGNLPAELPFSADLLARRLEALGMPVAYHNRSRVEGAPYAYYPSLRALAEAVDTLICVAPGGKGTEKAVSAEILKALGPDGVFVNVGRGSSVDEDALAAALENGTIRAAGLDVFAREPNVPQRLLDLPNACLLPHVGSSTVHTRNAMADLQVENLVSWFSEGRALTPVPETRDVRPKT